jgi:type 1 glutamine amidotransferase
MTTRPFLAFALAGLVAGLVVGLLARPLAAADPPRVLVYQKNGKGFVHDNLEASATAIRELGAEHGFAVDVSSDPAVFTDHSLKAYRALVFANTNNEGFASDAQREAFQRYLRGGGGFVGIHSSTGSERTWEWFQKMQGARFLRHPPMQKFSIRVVDPSHPATAHLASPWTWEDECYFFTNLNPDIHVLMAAELEGLTDPQRLSQPGASLHGVHPLAWCHHFEGARVFYTALGHRKDSYRDPVFRRHLAGGMLWALNQAPASAKTTP